MTQCEKILAWLESGKTITALVALHEFQCFRLAARINDLRSPEGGGHDILSEPYSYKNSSGETITIAKYSMKIPVMEQGEML